MAGASRENGANRGVGIDDGAISGVASGEVPMPCC